MKCTLTVIMSLEIRTRRGRLLIHVDYLEMSIISLVTYICNEIRLVNRQFLLNMLYTAVQMISYCFVQKIM